MTVAYETDNVTLHHGDARLVLAGLATESVELILTDPPYGVSHSSNQRAESFGEIIGDGAEDRDDIHAVLEHCVRIVKQKRHLYIFGPKDVLSGLKLSETTELIWDRGVIGQGDLSSSWGPQHEPISFATSFHRHAGKVGQSSPAVRLRKGSVLRFMRSTGRLTKHPNQKPTALLRELIESSTRQGDVVLDPFSGIGSTGVAAIEAGRKAILVELDERWIEPTIARLQRAEALRKEMQGV